MTIKEYLSQAFVLNKIIQAKQLRIQELRNMQMGLSGGLSDIKVLTSKAHDPLGNATAVLLDAEAQCQRDILKLIEIQKEIEETINTLKQSDLRLVLYERYVNLKKWEDVASDNNYSWREVHRKHKRALEKLGIEWHSLDVL